MDALSAHILGGDTFIPGCFLVAAGVAFSLNSAKRPVRKWISAGLFVLGLSMMMLAGFPVGALTFNIMALSIITIHLLAGFESRPTALCLNLFRVLLVLCCAHAALNDAERRAIPSLPRLGERKIYVLLDSLSPPAEKDKPRATWADALRNSSSLRIYNIAPDSQDQRTAVEKARLLSGSDASVILEPGLNSLDRADPVAFRRDLDELLRMLSANRSRLIVMFELPVWPGKAGYLKTQRELAAKHGARLVPRRVLAVMTRTPGNVGPDGLLTERGTTAMAAFVLSMANGSMDKNAASAAIKNGSCSAVEGNGQ